MFTEKMWRTQVTITAQLLTMHRKIKQTRYTIYICHVNIYYSRTHKRITSYFIIAVTERFQNDQDWITYYCLVYVHRYFNVKR